MLELDAAGERFRELLHLVDDSARKRGVGEEALPLVRQVGTEIGNDRVACASIVELRALENMPLDPADLHDLVGGPERHDGYSPPQPALGVDVKQIQPRNVEQEAGGEAEAIVWKSGQDEPDDG